MSQVFWGFLVFTVSYVKLCRKTVLPNKIRTRIQEKKMDRQKQKDMLRKMKGVGRKLIHVIWKK